MLHYQKFIGETDTMLSRVRYYFQKVAQDTITGYYFHHQKEVQDKHGKSHSFQQLYNGKALAYTEDSAVVLMTVEKWATEIKNFIRANDFLNLLLRPEKSAIVRNQQKWKAPAVLVGETQVGNTACWHVKIRIDETPNPEETISVLSSNFDFWIAQSDTTPIQYDITYKLLMGPDTVWQYDRYLLTHYHWAQMNAADSTFDLKRLPNHLKIRDYVPYQAPELLKEGEPAPQWELTSLNGEIINIGKLRGKLLLLDFFYKSCYPCLQALPVLQQLHEKYQSKDLMIIGVNPFDKKSDGIGEFLSRRNITYTVVLDDDGKVANTYRVSAYPTMYLINQQGKIVWVEVGFGSDSANMLEQTILKYLNE